jgi:hypothetical protein
LFLNRSCASFQADQFKLRALLFALQAADAFQQNRVRQCRLAAQCELFCLQLAEMILSLVGRLLLFLLLRLHFAG